MLVFTIANYTCGIFETIDSTPSAIGLSKWSMERYLKKLQGEKADLEKKLEGLLAGDFKPFDVANQGKKIYRTQEHIATVRKRLKELEAVISRETIRKP